MRRLTISTSVTLLSSSPHFVRRKPSRSLSISMQGSLLVLQLVKSHWQALIHRQEPKAVITYSQQQYLEMKECISK